MLFSPPLLASGRVKFRNTASFAWGLTSGALPLKLGVHDAQRVRVHLRFRSIHAYGREINFHDLMTTKTTLLL